MPVADDGRQLLFRDFRLSEAFISPAACPDCTRDGIKDETLISYTVIGLDTIRVALTVYYPNGEFIGDIVPLAPKAPDPHVVPFSGVLPGQVPYSLPDGTYGIAIRAVSDTGRVEADTLSLVIDRMAPPVDTVTTLGGITTHRDGDTIVIEVDSNEPGYSIVPNFSSIDSDTAGGTVILDRGNGRYEVRHTISPDNSRPDAGNLLIPIRVVDRAGNRTNYNALRLCLSNTPPRFLSARATNNDGSYRNGNTIIIESAWESPDTILTVWADFSGLDSNYQIGEADTVRLSGNRYRSSYLLSLENMNPDAEYLVPILARDRGCGVSTIATVPIRIDTEAGERPVLDPLPAGVRTALLPVSGLAAGSIRVEILRNGVLSDTVATGPGGRFAGSVTLAPGTNTITVAGYDAAGNRTTPSTAASVVFVIDQFINMPVPFRPGGTIEVGAERMGARVTVEFWTLGGNLARRLTDESDREVYFLTWDGADESGVRLNSGPLIAVVTTEFADGGRRTDRRAMMLAPPAAAQ